MIVSTVIITVVGTLVTDYIVEPRLGKYNPKEGEASVEKEADYGVSPLEIKGLWAALATLLIYIALVLWAALPADGILREPTTHSLTSPQAPLIRGIIIIMAMAFLLPGLAYGFVTKSLRNDHDIVGIFERSMRNMGGYIVLALFASQFIYLFTYSQVGTILAVSGAEFLKNTNMTGRGTIQLFILIAAFINLFMGSASAKWAILAPIFVPMFMQLGYHPAFVQVAYRIGDSTTNIISPLLSYLPIIITFVHRYNSKAGIGTLISMMFPYSLFFLISWSLLLVIWFVFNLPLGPGVYSMLN
jgi:aminobenzoyl-glutamate transport protein